MVSLGHLLNDMFQAVIPAIYPTLKEALGLSFLQIGAITLVNQLTSSLLQPMVGYLSDRHPRPYGLAVGMCFTLTGLEPETAYYLRLRSENDGRVVKYSDIVGPYTTEEKEHPPAGVMFLIY